MTDSAWQHDPGSTTGAAAPEDNQGVRVLSGASAREFDHPKIHAAVRALFEAVGMDPDAAPVRGTPERVARMFDEIFAGLLVDPAEVVDVVFEEGHDELVLERGISFASICEHHLVPFLGVAHVGYLPNERGQITGLSKLARLVDAVTKRPSLQERITTEIADTLEKVLEPRGVIVVLEAEHLCMTMRGVRKPGAVTITSAVRGVLRDDPRTRMEALMLLGHGGGRAL